MACGELSLGEGIHDRTVCSQCCVLHVTCCLPFLCLAFDDRQTVDVLLISFNLPRPHHLQPQRQLPSTASLAATMCIVSIIYTQCHNPRCDLHTSAPKTTREKVCRAAIDHGYPQGAPFDCPESHRVGHSKVRRGKGSVICSRCKRGAVEQSKKPKRPR